MQNPSLLVELRTEELPPAQVGALAAAFPTLLLTALRDAGFAGDYAAPTGGGAVPALLATPRRFAALLIDIRERSPDRQFFRRGPRLAACRDADGNPTQVLLGFMRSVGVTCEQALTRVTEKGHEHIAYEGTAAGEALATALPPLVEKTLLAIHAPRLMRWGDHNFKFIRPLRGVLLLHGQTPILGATILAANTTPDTVGHPVLAPTAVTVATADDYEAALKKDGAVIVDINERKASILKQFNGAAAQPETLLDEVTAMCENPSVYTGTIDEKFLALPDFCLQGCMVKHQRAFPARKNGWLTAAYRFVADSRPAKPEVMIAGFNTVLRARLRDVEFYLGEDKKLTLADAFAKLDGITYHRRLGSQRQRVRRLADIAAAIAGMLGLSAADQALVRRAAEVGKCDLPTLMISEYPELAGLMAGVYFCSGDDDARLRTLVCCQNAQYARDWRRQTADLPDASDRDAAYALLLANALETLVGIFGVGEAPSGNKDPHGLRTAATIVAGVQQATERRLPLDALIDAAYAVFAELPAFDAEALWDFIAERKKQELLAEGGDRAVLNAVLATRQKFVIEIEEKAAALAAFLGWQEAAAVIEVNKRINNILRKSGVAAAALPAVDDSLFSEASERLLWAAIENHRRQSEEALRLLNYGTALMHATAVKPAVDDFFDHTLVNAEDEKLRHNRFALLVELRALLNTVGDLSGLNMKAPADNAP